MHDEKREYLCTVRSSTYMVHILGPQPHPRPPVRRIKCNIKHDPIDGKTPKVYGIHPCLIFYFI